MPLFFIPFCFSGQETGREERWRPDSKFNNDFVIFFFKDSQFLKGFEGSIGVKETICSGTTAPLHIFIVIVRDKTLFLQLGDKCNSLQDLTQLMCRKQHCTWETRWPPQIYCNPILSWSFANSSKWWFFAVRSLWALQLTSLGSEFNPKTRTI